MTDQTDRYHRQTLLPQIGPEGAARIRRASVTLIGCGALGTGMAEILVRAGVGTLRIADRDFVERSNLQRQVLFSESDADERLPKAVAAARALSAVNSDVILRAEVTDVTPRNIEALVRDAQVVLDGTDNAETRFLINDACVKHGVPWVYGGAVGTEGLTAPIVPGSGPCLRCFMPDPPPPGALPTCDTLGVLAPITLTVAALQAAAAIKLIIGDLSGVGGLTRIDIWSPRMRTLTVARRPGCPACDEGRFPFLAAERTAWATRLCGRNAVQITPEAGSSPLDLSALCERLAGRVRCRYNGILLTIHAEPYELIVFPDGRCMVQGTTDEAAARGVIARFLG